MPPAAFAFLVTFISSLFTGIGTVITFYARRTNYRYLAILSGFSSGMLIFAALVVVFHKALDSLSTTFDAHIGFGLAAAGFCSGMIMRYAMNLGMARQNMAVKERPQPGGGIKDQFGSTNILRSIHSAQIRPSFYDEPLTDPFIAPPAPAPASSLTPATIALHNLPEGLSIFIILCIDPWVGIAIALAASIQTIPEGIRSSVAIYHATGDRLRTFTLSLMPTIFEMAGALLGWLLWIALRSQPAWGVVLGGVAGIIIVLSIDDLLPILQNHGINRQVLFGVLAGMAVMSIILIWIS